MVKVAIIVLALSAPTVGLVAAVQTTQPTQTTPARSSTRPPARPRPRPAPAKKPTTAKPPVTNPAPPAADPAPPVATTTAPVAAAAASTTAATQPRGATGNTGNDSWLLLIAGVLAAVGGLQWWAVRQIGRNVRDGLAQTKDAADAAAISAAAAAKALAASERAYLVARNWAMRPPAVGEIPEVEFVVENVGRTPARRTLVRGQIEVRDTPLPERPGWRTAEAAGGTLTIPPGGRPASTLAGDQPLTREDLERLRGGAAFLSIWGRVDYEDVLGNAQTVSFAWRFDVTTGALTYDTVSDAYHEAT